MDYKKNLIGHIQSILKSDEFTNDLFDSISIELNNTSHQLELTFQELFIDSATGDGIVALEKRLGIVTDILKPIEQRRSLLKARLRGRKKVSISVVDSICEAWINGEVDTSIISNKIKVVFISIGGIPDKLSDLEETLYKLIPTHLEIEWEFTYLTWDKLESYNLDWDEFETLNLNWNELEVYI